MSNLSEEEKDKIIRKFRKICIKCWTSEQYKIPADSKEVAEFKAMEVCLFLRDALGDTIKGK